MHRALPLAAAVLLAAGAARAETTPAATPVPAALPSSQLAPVAPAAPGADAFRLLALQEAAKAGLPYALVDAVIKIESDYRADRIGGVGEIGLMQVRPGTAAMLGFKGSPQALADPATNIHYGATYLGQAWRLTSGDVCRTLMKYRAGHGEEVMSALSATYCARARAHLAAIGSPLAAMITPADLAAVGQAVAVARTQAAKPGVGRARSGKAFWAAFETKIRKINARIESRWRKVAAR